MTCVTLYPKGFLSDMFIIGMLSDFAHKNGKREEHSSNAIQFSKINSNFWSK